VGRESRLDGYADCLAGFLAKLGLDTARLAGLSFGGILALALQRRHSAMSSALILVSAYAGWAGSLLPEVAEQQAGRRSHFRAAASGRSTLSRTSALA
jgi:pimeloyl-ACP methyl ester carboxylesterase